ncbi:MAG: hypothetical protein PHS98_04605 [Bacilli bacterium]|nr:hypothetical protein [Bacilli bacterium]
MSEKTQLVQLAKDIYKNRFNHQNYSQNDASDVLRNALVEMNGGTKLDFKSFRRNKVEMFEIIEEILENTVLEGLPEDSFFSQFVEYKNLALGDKNSFYIPDNTNLVVSEIADGTSALRRQRIDRGTDVSIPTSWKGVKIYEHLSRLLAGRVDFNEMLQALEKAFKLKINDDVYNAFIGSFTSLPDRFTASGSFDEDSLIDIIEHVEAASGKKALIAGTMKALRKVTTAVVSNSAKEDVYKMGYFGSFNGTPMARIKQVHNVGGYTFKLSENDIYVVTTDEKPVKFVTEGEVRIVDGDALANADLTQDYFSATKYGTGVVITDLYGKFEVSA